MSAKLGSTDVSFRLGAVTPAAVYLGAEQVWTAVVARTLYFLGNAELFDYDWQSLGNWWLDSGFSVPADSLPTAADSVFIAEGITNSGDVPTVANLNVTSGTFSVDIVVTGMATFSEIGEFVGSLTGNATFNDSSQNYGAVTGNATFNDSSQNYGAVTGNATFNDSSANYGTVTGTATFTGDSCNAGGTAGTFVPDPPPSCE